VEYDWDADKLGLAIESMEVPDSSLLHSEVFSLTDMVPGAMAIDLICRREFDLSIVEYANGKPLNEILGISYKDLKGVIQHNPDHPQLTQEQRRKTPQRFLAPFWSAATSSIPLISIPGPTLRRSSATLSPRTAPAASEWFWPKALCSKFSVLNYSGRDRMQDEVELYPVAVPR
jgi:hypothetical protein